ncbi:MAG: heparan-alpha-glucosaminide N-acetyltransferase domain-containing protein, partial [Chitinophagaceae bacterium]
AIKSKRVESIDLLRGLVMIIMALDHVRHFFHRDAFLYEPTDLNRTTVFLFFTRFITHYCAPIFVFLAGTSAYLSGIKKTKRELSQYLFTRGLWLVFVELFIIILGQTFNPTYPYFNLQVIWAIGVSMMILSALIYLKRQVTLVIAILLIGGHNLLDTLHVQGTGPAAFSWAVLHEPKEFIWGHKTFYVMYPVIPWIGIIAIGYCLGSLYHSSYDAVKRRKTLFLIGFSAIALFIILRFFNIYGDAAHWSVQKSISFSLLSILNVTKYPPSLLYTLITLGPALIFLAVSEKPLNAFKNKVTVFGRTPFFYYVVHIYMIHLFAMIGAVVLGYNWSDMILKTKVNRVPELKGYGVDLLTTYIIWIVLIICLYPLCRWFDQYKRMNQAKQWWLTYL